MLDQKYIERIQKGMIVAAVYRQGVWIDPSDPEQGYRPVYQAAMGKILQTGRDHANILFAFYSFPRVKVKLNELTAAYFFEFLPDAEKLARRLNELHGNDVIKGSQLIGMPPCCAELPEI